MEEGEGLVSRLVIPSEVNLYPVARGGTYAARRRSTHTHDNTKRPWGARLGRPAHSLQMRGSTDCSQRES